MKKRTSLLSLALFGLLQAVASPLAALAVPLPSATASPAPLSGPAGMSPLQAPELETLPNGLTVAWFTRSALPMVDISLIVKSGFRDDPVGRTGTAEMVSALLDRGAGGMSAKELGRAVESLGASRFSSADDDTFSVGLHGLAEDGPRLAEILAKMTLQPAFDAAEIERERDRMIDHWSHVSDYAESLAGLVFYRAMRSGSSYGRGNFLSIAELRRIGRADLIAYHKAHFVPGNSLLLVVGKVDRPRLRADLLTHFGDPAKWSGGLPGRDWKNYTDPKLHPRKGEILVVHRPGFAQAQVRLGLKAPLIQSPDHYPLMVANAMLGEYFNSRLNSIIRDKLGLTYSIGSGFTFSRDFASFTIASSTRNESVGQLVRKTVDVLRELRRGPVPVEETRMARDYLLGQFTLAHATQGAVAARWLRSQYYGLGDSYLNGFSAEVAKVNSPEVIGALNRHLDPERLVIVVAGDAPEIEKSLKAAKLGPVRRIGVKDLL